MALTLNNARSIPTSSRAVIFRDVSYRGLLFGGLLFALLACYGALPKADGVNWVAVAIPGMMAGWLFAWGGWRRLREGAGNWLLVVADEGIHINLAYAEGYPIIHDDAPVLFVASEEMCCVRPVREIIRLPHRFGTTRHHFGAFDIVLQRPVPDEVVYSLIRCQERYAQAGKSGPFPVRCVAPNVLRLQWSAIRPKEEKALECLAGLCDAQGPRKIVFPEWNRLNARQRDIFLGELWRMGMREEALFLGRIHLGVSMAETKATMEKGHSGPL